MKVFIIGLPLLIAACTSVYVHPPVKGKGTVVNVIEIPENTDELDPELDK